MSLATMTEAPVANGIWGMTADSKSAGEAFEVCPKGNHMARIVAVIDLGVQPTNFKDQKDQRQLVIVVELTKKQATGKPFVLAERYSWSMNAKANFRNMVEGITGKNFPDGSKYDPRELLSVACMASVAQTSSMKDGKERTYANIQGISAYPDGLPDLAPPLHAAFTWSVLEGTPAPDFDWLPRVYGKEIKNLAELAKRPGGAAGGANLVRSDSAPSDSSPSSMVGPAGEVIPF